jgi:hypothetical protein
MDCSTWFLVVFKPKMTYPLPLGFQHTQYCGESLAGSFSGVWCAVLLPCMLNSVRALHDFRKITWPIISLL